MPAQSSKLPGALFGASGRNNCDALIENVCAEVGPDDCSGRGPDQNSVIQGLGVAPMPPLGTLVQNPLLAPLITEWILDPQNPCP